ncbi:MAG: methylmalonyl Co-A mutase-associated GTPase MeaB [Chloroflexota bacterium]|nr:methylmalonyl Co-A mutase-associated GTPase MeaB [Chloroflexota bacterium]
MTLTDNLLAGNRRALARTITLVENNGAEAHEALATLYPHTGQAHIVGVTGAPGTGKSTLVNGLARAYRGHDQQVGIVAVDPTSPFTGGALLGDRVRMRDLSGDPGIFIRSMATRGSLGGLARATANVIMLLDAAGFERIIVETVGVGQAEVEIASIAHTTVVVEAPGLGDEVQAIKAGILEIADLLVVNKADREGVDKAVLALQMMLGIGAARPAGGVVVHHGQAMSVDQPPVYGEGWVPPILKTIAPRHEGITELMAGIEDHREFLHSTEEFQRREENRARSIIFQILQSAVLEQLRITKSEQELQQLIQAVTRRQIDPYRAAERLLPSVLRS